MFAVEEPNGRRSLLPGAIDSTDRLALLIQNPELLHNDEVVRCNEIQSCATEGWSEDEGGRRVDC